MNDHEFIHEVRSFLSNWRTLSLATVDPQGHAHAANIQFAVDENLALYFVSSLKSAHSQHIAADPRIALTIYAHTDEHTQIHGVQMHAWCERLIEEAEQLHAWEVYLKRFTFIAGDPMFEKQIRSEAFFKVTPTWVRWIDNRRGFGFRMEQHWSA